MKKWDICPRWLPVANWGKSLSFSRACKAILCVSLPSNTHMALSCCLPCPTALTEETGYLVNNMKHTRQHDTKLWGKRCLWMLPDKWSSTNLLPLTKAVWATTLRIIPRPIDWVHQILYGWQFKPAEVHILWILPISQISLWKSDSSHWCYFLP